MNHKSVRHLQAKVLVDRAKKVVVGLAVIALITQAINITCLAVADTYTFDHAVLIIFFMVMPLSVLIINAHLLRRQSNAVETHQDDQSTSAVPTIMLIIISLIYVLICCMASIVQAVFEFTPQSVPSLASWVVLYKWYAVTSALFYLLCAYKFFVYLITGKRFRSELRWLCKRCRVNF